MIFLNSCDPSISGGGGVVPIKMFPSHSGKFLKFLKLCETAWLQQSSLTSPACRD